MNRIEAAGAAGVLALSLAACSSGKSETPSPIASRPSASSAPSETTVPEASAKFTPGKRLYNLEKRRDGTSFDPALVRKPQKGIENVTLSYDSQDNALHSKVCFDPKNTPDELRIISYEVSPHEGWLYDGTYKVKERMDEDGCMTNTPVINLGPKDKEIVLFGTSYLPESKKNQDSYNKMLVYEFVKSSNEVNRRANATPKHPFKFRDPQPQPS